MIISTFTLREELQLRGWYAQPQLSFGDSPPTMHVSVSAATTLRLPESTPSADREVGVRSRAGDPGPRGCDRRGSTRLGRPRRGRISELLQVAGLIAPWASPCLSDWHRQRIAGQRSRSDPGSTADRLS
jgi:hypothetical protein